MTKLNRSDLPKGRPWTIRNSRQRRPSAAPVPAALPTLDTRYTLTWLDADGEIGEASRAGPSTPLFAESFAALSRGSLVATPNGPVAVEDLLPGDRVITHRGASTLIWKGSCAVARGSEAIPLFRVLAEHLGPGRPMPDLILGPGARLVSRRSSLRDLIGAEAALVPIASLADGEAVLRIRPMSTMQLFQLGFARHSTFTVNGVEVDSVYPQAKEAEHTGAVRALYLSMFPHLEDVPDIGRLTMERLDGELLERVTRVA